MFRRFFLLASLILGLQSYAGAGPVGFIAGALAGGASIGSAIIGAVVSVGISMAAQAIFGKKPQAPSGSVGGGSSSLPEQRKITSKDPVAPRTLLYGKCRQYGNLIFHETSNNNRDYVQVRVVSEGEVEGPQTTQINSDFVTVSYSEGSVNSVGSGKYSGNFSYGYRTGATGQAVMSWLDTNLTSVWSTNHTLSGIAYDVCKFTLKSGIYEGGTPQVSSVWKGIKCYDPRTATTVWTENPIIILRDYLLRVNPDLSASDLDSDSWDAAANICDESVVITTSATDSTPTAASNSNFDSFSGTTSSASGSVSIAYNESDTKRFYFPIAVTSGQKFSIQFYADTHISKSLATSTLKGPSKFRRRGKNLKLETAFNVGVSSSLGFSNDIVASKTVYKGVQSISFTAASSGTYYITFSLANYQPSGITLTSGSQTVYLDISNLKYQGSITGNTENRYTCNGTILLDDGEISGNVEKILACCNGRLFPYQGKLYVYAAAYTTPTEEITEDDFRGSVVVTNHVQEADSFNTIRGLFVDPANDWQLTDFPPVIHTYLKTRDGGEKAFQLDLDLVTSKSLARRLCWLHLKQHRQDLKVKFSTSLRLYDVLPTDFVKITNSLFGWDQKEFQVMSMDIDWVNGLINFECQESNSAIFDYTYVDDSVVDASPNTNLGLILSGSPNSIITVSSLPSNAAGTQGDVVLSLSDNKIYRHDGSTFISSITADDITTGTIGAETITLTNSSSSKIKSDNYSAGTSGWQIDGAGNAELNNATIRGNLGAATINAETLTMTNSSSSKIKTSNYSAGSAGWQVDGTGNAEFNTVKIRVDTGSKVNTSGDLSSQGFSTGSTGWQIKGNGDAEFNNITARGKLGAGGGFFNPGISGSNRFDGQVFIGENQLELAAYFSDAGPWYSGTKTVYGPTSSSGSANYNNTIAGTVDYIFWLNIVAPYNSVTGGGGIRYDAGGAPAGSSSSTIDLSYDFQYRLNGGSWTTIFSSLTGSSGTFGTSGQAGTWYERARIRWVAEDQRDLSTQKTANLSFATTANGTYDFRVRFNALNKSNSNSTNAWYCFANWGVIFNNLTSI